MILATIKQKRSHIIYSGPHSMKLGKRSPRYCYMCALLSKDGLFIVLGDKLLERRHS